MMPATMESDELDDRIAEILDELLDQREAKRPGRRLTRALGAVSLVLALTALQYRGYAPWIIWPATAVICLVILRAAYRLPLTAYPYPPACSASRSE